MSISENSFCFGCCVFLQSTLVYLNLDLGYRSYNLKCNKREGNTNLGLGGGGGLDVQQISRQI